MKEASNKSTDIITKMNINDITNEKYNKINIDNNSNDNNKNQENNHYKNGLSNRKQKTNHNE